ncbi:MAG: SIS domain-containing protein [Candidatus Limnocylindrales bacterium]
MSDIPELRDGPPWVMEEMILAEPDLAATLVGDAKVSAAASRIASAISATADAGEPTVVVGCGTSEHAAMAIVRTVLDAVPDAPIWSRQAFEASLEPVHGGVCIAVSHEGETHATLAALSAAAEAGAVTALITGAADPPGAKLATHVLATPMTDRSWCHTVGYVSPMLAGGAIAAVLRGVPLDGAALATHLRSCLSVREAARDVADALAEAGMSRLVVCGSGVDRVSAREFALKVEEGVHIPSVARATETELHGHMVSADERCGLVVFVTDPRRADARAARARQLLLAARHLGMPTAAIVDPSLVGDWDPGLTSAGRIELPTGTDLPRAFAAMTGGAIALQLLTLEMAHVAGTNPDRIRREVDLYRESAALASP